MNNNNHRRKGVAAPSGRKLSSSSSSSSSCSSQERREPVSAAFRREIPVLERLIWVKYQSHWWPALLYQSYSELQGHLYKEMDTVLKAQFAMAILKHNKRQGRKGEDHNNKTIMVAKLLGRPSLEILEVNQKGYCEFYFHLPHVMETAGACQRKRYTSEELYLDFHRAMDQVEDLIRAASSKRNFALMPSEDDDMSWLDRAQLALKYGDDGDSSSVSTTRQKHPKAKHHDKKRPQFATTSARTTISEEQRECYAVDEVEMPRYSSTKQQHGSSSRDHYYLLQRESVASTEMMDNRRQPASPTSPQGVPRREEEVVEYPNPLLLRDPHPKEASHQSPFFRLDGSSESINNKHSDTMAKKDNERGQPPPVVDNKSKANKDDLVRRGREGRSLMDESTVTSSSLSIQPATPQRQRILVVPPEDMGTSSLFWRAISCSD